MEMEKKRGSNPPPFKPTPIFSRTRIIEDEEERTLDLDDIYYRLDAIQKRLDEFYKMYLKDRIRAEDRELKHTKRKR